MANEKEKKVDAVIDKAADKAAGIITKVLIGVVAILICYGGLELAHKNGIRATLQMKCEQIKGFKSIDSLDVPWFSIVKKFDKSVYPCKAKLKMVGADGTEQIVNVQFDAARSSVADDLKDAMSGRNDNDWALNWYPWGDEYTVKNLKSMD